MIPNCTYGSTDNDNTTVASVLLLPMALTTLILNALSLCVLIRSKRVRKSKFLCVLIFLSVNNVALSSTTIATISTALIQLKCVFIGQVCLYLQIIANIAMSCSLLQVMFICIERLIAMFSLVNKNTWSHAYAIIYIISMILMAGYVIVLFLIYADFNSSSCRVDEIFVDNLRYFQLFIAGKRLLLICVTTVIYMVVFVRLKINTNKIAPFSNAEAQRSGKEETKCNQVPSTSKDIPISLKLRNEKHSSIENMPKIASKNKTTYQSSTSSETYNQRNRMNVFAIDQHSKDPSTSMTNGTKREPSNASTSRFIKFRRSMTTLIIIIIASSACVLPSVITNIYSALSYGGVTVKTIEFTNIFIILNPLIDPIVYVLRIKDFRNKLKCRP